MPNSTSRPSANCTVNQGVKLYWIVDPERREVLVFEDDNEEPTIYRKNAKVEVKLLPGLVFDVGELTKKTVPLARVGWIYQLGPSHHLPISEFRAASRIKLGHHPPTYPWGRRFANL
jgi:hypothetical protein